MGARILVVDDDRDLLLLVRLVLKRRGWEILTATSGAEALLVVDRYPPDLILLDIVMPDISGPELCARLRADPRFQQVPILALTAMDRLQEQDLARRAGVNDVMLKPFAPAALVERVQSLLMPRAISSN